MPRSYTIVSVVVVLLFLSGCTTTPTPLIRAALEGNNAAVGALLDQGEDVNQSISYYDQVTFTPIMAAADQGHVDTIDLLLGRGADINRESSCRTALYRAACQGQSEAAEHLIRKGAEVDPEKPESFFCIYISTPLQCAAREGHYETVKVLVENGADVNAATHYGWTPLYLAANNGHLKIVKYLVNKGANLAAVTDNKTTPLQAAEKGGHTAVAQFLRDAQAGRIARISEVAPEDPTLDATIEMYAKMYRGIIGGVGVEMEAVDGAIVVRAVKEGLPAAEGGIKKGDRIVGIGGTPVKDMVLPEVAKLIPGPVGTSVVLSIAPGGTAEQREVTLIREPVRFVFPEEARKYKAQAEYAFNEKRFEDAVGLYAKALQVAPWWPEGHFNTALLLGELAHYEEAIRAMKRYLLFAPDAPDARAAQDRIYQWESVVE